MLKPPPSATIPGVTDTLDFVKNLWGSMSLPGASLPGMSGMTGPPMSVEDLDKRIADMKAVESWLNLNLTMLRGTIQTMEVQRSTLATLKSMGASMAEAMRQSGVSAEKMANTPFAPFFGQPAATGTKPAAKEGEPAQAGAAASAASPGAAPDALPGADAGAAMGMPAAMAWWNLLQEQFTQAVTTAMTPASAGSAGAADSKPAEGPSVSQPKPSSASANLPPENGNGKTRTAKPKADKT